jgi:hypothetical protein
MVDTDGFAARDCAHWRDGSCILQVSHLRCLPDEHVCGLMLAHEPCPDDCGLFELATERMPERKCADCIHQRVCLIVAASDECRAAPTCVEYLAKLSAKP